MASLNFNANLVEPTQDFEPVPAGKYEAVIIESEMVPTKSGNGSFLKITFEIVSDEYKGRRLWARLNLFNSSAVAVDIAKKELSAICRAVGVMEPRDSSELHNIPLMLRVTVANGSNGPTNEIKGYSAKDAQAATPPAPPAAKPANGKAPW